MKKFRRVLILIAAAGAGILVYKAQRFMMTAPGTQNVPGQNIYATLTGPGSIGDTWNHSTNARDAGSPPSARSPRPPGKLDDVSPDDLALLEAAARGDKRAVDKRLSQGAKVDSRDSERRTPLMYASWNGYDDISSRLVAAGANPEFQDRAGNNAFDYAAGRGQTQHLQFLLQRTRMNDTKHYMEYAQLLRAAFANDPGSVLNGMGKLASVNRINPEGVAPLHITAGNGSVDLSEALIQRGAQVNIRNGMNQTPLHWAAWNNQPKSIELLLRKGADIEQADMAGNTALILAAQNNSRAAVDMLLAKGADRYATNRQGKTAGIIADDNGNSELATLLK